MGQFSEVQEKLLLLRLDIRGLMATARLDPPALGLVERHSATSRQLGLTVRDLHHALRALDRKANFDPNQPREPAGNSDGGQWTNSGGSAGTTRLQTGRASSDAPPPDSGDQPPLRVTIEARPRDESRLDIDQLGDPEEGIPPTLREEPEIPAEKPPTTRARNTIAKTVSRWGLALLRLHPHIRITLTIGHWLFEELSPLIHASWDEPKSLEELQYNVRNPQDGYDIHHIVEKEAARKAGFPEEWIEGPDNLVRIPRLKHWLITAEYSDQRRALMPLYGHLDPQVRLKAIRATLAVAPEEARRQLEKLAASGEQPQSGQAGMAIYYLDTGMINPT